MIKNCCSVRSLFLLTCAVVLLLGGVLFLSFWGMSRIIKEQLHKQTELEKGTIQWDRFEKLPFPIDFTIRFWNVTNTDGIMKMNETPILQESKPYTYAMNIIKKNIIFNDTDDTVTYDRALTFSFNGTSTTKENDVVTIINPVLLSALQLTSSLEKLALAGCMHTIFNGSGLDEMFITKPVNSLLFDGIEFAFSDEQRLGVACRIVREKMIQIVKGIRVIEHVNDTKLNRDYLRFSIFNYKTESYLKENPDGIYTINRGINEMSELGNIMRWNGETHLKTWGTRTSINNETCNRVRGTDSTIYKPQIQKGEALDIFNTDICRSVKLVYKSSSESYKGINAYRYETSPSTFWPSTENPENDCFCFKATKNIQGNDYCFLDGLFDFKPCLGAPVLISMPHFLDADEVYLKGVHGLSPNREKHGIYLLLEPETGTPLEGKKRIQMNVVLKQELLISKVTPRTMYQGIVPVLWLEEGVSLPQEYVDLVNEQYFSKVSLANGLKYGLIAVVSASLAATLFFLLRKIIFKTKKGKTKMRKY